MHQECRPTLFANMKFTSVSFFALTFIPGVNISFEHALACRPDITISLYSIDISFGGVRFF